VASVAHEAGPPPLATSEAAAVAERIVANVARVIHAPDELLRLLVVSLVAEGHVILEDAPGVGKTMLAKVLSRSVDCGFSRLQFTPDLLPSDVTGVSVYNQQTNRFEFRPGPVFTNLLLVDEINRASPKVQAALLECMQERQVTVDGVTHELSSPFMVVATQNPVEYEGTYPLPEAQLDRFTMLLHLGYPEPAEEASMLGEQSRTDALDTIMPVASTADVQGMIDAARALYVEESLNRYTVALLRATRADGRLVLGASPRSGISLLRAAKALALMAGREFVIPDDIKAVAVPVLSHRLILGPEARAAGVSGADLVAETVQRTAVPL
jgi:MoxR-like ATPase